MALYMRKIEEKNIFDACRYLVANSIKLTGNNLKDKLITDYGQSCDTKFLYDALNKFKKFHDFDDFDKDNLEAGEFPPSCPLPPVDEVSPSGQIPFSFSELDQLGQSCQYFPLCFFNSKVNVSNITQDNHSVVDYTNFKKEVENLKAILDDFITRFDTIPSNGSLNSNKGSKNGVSVNQ